MKTILPGGLMSWNSDSRYFSKKLQKTLAFFFRPCYNSTRDFKALHKRFKSGVLAQLGERYTGSVEVSGSIPLCSTIHPQAFGSAGFVLHTSFHF